MSIWNYAYLFPGPLQELNPVGLFDALERLDLEYDQRVIALKDDGEGHHVEDETLDNVKKEEVREMLKEKKNLAITCRNRDISIACYFVIAASNPHIFLGWDRRIFESLEEAKQTFYVDGIREAAKKANAVYVVFMVEVPDFFDDRFVDVDGVRIIDPFLRSGKLAPILEVWVDHSRGGVLPSGVEFYEGQDLSNGFLSHVPKIL